MRGTATRERAVTGRPWLLLCLSMAVHVTDEMCTGFLPAYRLAVEAIRDLFPQLPVPMLGVGAWVALTVGLVGALMAMTPLAYRGARGMRAATIGLACLALANVVGHAGASLLARRAMPGVYSTPLLAVVGVYAIVVVSRGRRRVSGGPVSGKDTRG